jgi:hypothetical protein
MHGRIEDGALVSDELPSLRLRPGPGFGYWGSCELEIAEIAVAARHHFLDVASSRLLVVQLEHFTAPDLTYSFELRDPIELGDELYGRMAFELQVAEEIAENPGREVETTVVHLEQEGVRLPNRHAVARFARICGPEQRHEIIVFVHEYGEGATLDGILDRALTAFQLEPLASPLA